MKNHLVMTNRSYSYRSNNYVSPSYSAVDSDGNINPYATFEYPRDESMAFSTLPHNTSNDSNDEIELEKERAQREAGFQAAGYQMKAGVSPKDKKLQHQSPPTKDKPVPQRYQNVPADLESKIIASRFCSLIGSRTDEGLLSYSLKNMIAILILVDNPSMIRVM